ncbi:MAG: hypothetical protein RSD32_05805 [Oscillospiraceae bacterium]
MKNKDEKKAGAMKLLGIFKNKYALLVLVVGLVLIILPTGSKEKAGGETKLEAPAFSLSAEETRLQNQLSKISGVGRCSVLLSVSGSVSRTLADSGEGTLVISAGGGDEVVELYYSVPEYLGAVVVCEGGGSAAVRLSVIQAVSAFSGLGSDEITVMSMG